MSKSKKQPGNSDNGIEYQQQGDYSNPNLSGSKEKEQDRNAEVEVQVNKEQADGFAPDQRDAIENTRPIGMDA